MVLPAVQRGARARLGALIIYHLAKHDVLTLNGQSQGILSVLVLGAGTDYALLLISRYREELHDYDSRFEAMIAAWRGPAPAIVASGATVILGLLCLSFGELNSTGASARSCAIGIACTLLVMLTFLPVAARPRRPVDLLAAHPAPRPRGRPRARTASGDGSPTPSRPARAAGLDRRDGRPARLRDRCIPTSRPTG